MTKNELYALGMPLGDCVTRPKLGGGYVCGGGGGSSSSSSSNQTSTTNIDKRQVVDTGGIGVSSDSSTVTVNNQTLDAGIVTKALDTVAGADATNGQGFNQLLTLADKLFTAGSETLQKQSDATMQQVSALNTIANDQKGQIDQKTLIILAVAGVGVMALKRKG